MSVSCTMPAKVYLARSCSPSVSAGLKTDITDVASSSVFAAVTACNIKIA